MLRNWTGLPWSWSRIGPDVHGSPPRPAVVLVTISSLPPCLRTSFTSSWILMPLWYTVIRPGSANLPPAHGRAGRRRGALHVLPVFGLEDFQVADVAIGGLAGADRRQHEQACQGQVPGSHGQDPPWAACGLARIGLAASGRLNVYPHQLVAV